MPCLEEPNEKQIVVEMSTNYIYNRNLLNNSPNSCNPPKKWFNNITGSKSIK